MSDRLWQMAIEAKVVDASEWLEIVLPEYVVRDGATVMVDGSWEIYDTEIRAFKDKLANVFWKNTFSFGFCRKTQDYLFGFYQKSPNYLFG